MRTFMAVLTLGCFFSLAGLAVAGPFGTEMGQTPEQFKDLKKEEVKGPAAEVYSSYTTDTLPKMNPIFVQYTLVFGKEGLAKVIAHTEIFKDDRYGKQVQEDYATLLNQLTKKYGKPKKYDFLKDGSYWNKDKDFVMGLYTGERSLAAFWEKNLPDNIAGISLLVNGSSPVHSYLSLIYEYKNFAALADEIEKAAQDAL